MKMNHKIIIMGIFIIVILFVCGCTTSNQNVLPSNKFVAVYAEMRDDGSIVSGTYPYPGMAETMSPFNVPGNFKIPANDSLKVYMGVQKIKESRVRLTTDLQVTKIYDLPYSISPEIMIVGVDKNGTVDMFYNNTSFNLQSGATWSSPIISIWNETNSFTIDNGTNYTYTIQYHRVWTIQNKGTVDK
jgi:hypothetical protein